MHDFSNHVVLVAGSTGGLGRIVAQAFLDAGAHLALPGRSADRLASLFPDLVDSPDHVLLGDFDVTDVESVSEAVKQTVEHFGRIDVLANTIGGYRAGTPVHKTPISTWDFMLDLNARSAFLLSQAVISVMLEQGSGKIIHTSARAGLQGSANSSAYSASKSAVISLVQSLSAEVKANGVNVNAVLPGTIDTSANREAMPNADTSRWVQPQALADVYLFLASDAARAIHGAAIPVYGLS